MKTNLDLITDIRAYVQKLPAKVEMRPYVSVERQADHFRISYYDSPFLVNWEQINIWFSYDQSLQKNNQEKLGIPAVYRLSLEMLNDADLKAKITDSSFILDTTFYFDEDGNILKTILLPKKLGEEKELVFDYDDEGRYREDITDADKEYIEKSLTILRDRIKDYLKETSSTSK